ncbi:hypothetical protein AAFH68_46790 [Flavobacterium sp. CGRL1]
MELIGIFADFEFIFPLILISATIAGIVYLVWVWGIIYHLEEKEESDKLYFKISYGIFFSYCLIMFVLNLEMDITKNPILLENSTWTILETIGSLYMLLVFASYIYVSYFVAKKITLLQNNNRIPEFFLFRSSVVFSYRSSIFTSQVVKAKDNL